MANIRPKDTDALSTLASNHEILVDGPDGFGTFLRDTFISQVAALIVANPTTYKIATLDGADKLTSSQDPSQAVSYKGVHNASTNSPALADGSGTAGDTYQVNVAGTRDYGSGSLTLAVGDALVYSGSVWQQVSGVANILDGISTPAAAQAALEVISEDESAEIAVTKLVGPALYFPASSSYVQTSDDAKQSFGDGTTDRAFGLFVKFNASTLADAYIVCKGTTSALNEYGLQLRSDGKLRFYLRDNSVPIDIYAETTSSVISADQWYSVIVTVNPTSASTARADDISIYVNGQSKAVTASNQATYVAMEDVTSASLLAGAGGGTYFKGLISVYQLQNRSLSSTEAIQLSRVGQLPFPDEWAGAFGGIETSDFSVGTDGYSGSNGVLAGASTIGGQSDALKFTVDTSSGTHNFSQLFTGIEVGKRYRIRFRYYIQSGQSNVDSLTVRFNNGAFEAGYGTTLDAWTTFEYEGIATDKTVEFYAADGSNVVFQDSGGDDDVYVKDITITAIGTSADFRAEDFNESAGKLLDRSSNNFVGVNNGATLVGKRRHISADTIDLKNLPTSSAGLSAGEVWSNSGVLTIVT